MRFETKLRPLSHICVRATAASPGAAMSTGTPYGVPRVYRNALTAFLRRAAGNPQHTRALATDALPSWFGISHASTGIRLGAEHSRGAQSRGVRGSVGRRLPARLGRTNRAQCTAYEQAPATNSAVIRACDGADHESRNQSISTRPRAFFSAYRKTSSPFCISTSYFSRSRYARDASHAGTCGATSWRRKNAFTPAGSTATRR